MGYRITTVSRLTGIPRNTLLAWERRYGLVKPERLDNGYRAYTDADIEYLRKVKQLVDTGYRISEAITLVDERTDGVVAPAGPLRVEQDWGAIRSRLVASLLAFDRSAAEACVLPVSMSGHAELLRSLYLPALRDVGEGWLAGHITVGQEHFASAFIRERMLAMLVSVGFGPPTGRRVLCACLPGERHEGGLLALAVRLTLRGFRVSWLGADVPVQDIADSAIRWNSELVCLSGSVAPDRVEANTRAVRQALPERCLLVVGGPVVHQRTLPELDGVVWADSTDTLWRTLGEPTGL